MTRLAASAPARIDLAGGTLDIWPLYLLHEGALTVNVAIELRARVEARSARDGKVRLVSRDRRQRTVRLANRPVRHGETLELLARLAGSLGPRGGVALTSDCEAPAGSGWADRQPSPSQRARSSPVSPVGGSGERSHRHGERPREPRSPDSRGHPGLPRGPLRRGLRAPPRAGPDPARADPIDPVSFAERVVLCDSGRSRSSGLSNWDMVRRRLSGEKRIATLMDRITRASREMRCALLACDWDACGEALDAEGRARSGLSPFVETPRISALIAAARRAGAIGGRSAAREGAAASCSSRAPAAGRPSSPRSPAREGRSSRYGLRAAASSGSRASAPSLAAVEPCLFTVAPSTRRRPAPRRQARSGRPSERGKPDGNSRVIARAR